MTVSQISLLRGLLIASVCLLVLPFLIGLIRRIWRNFSGKEGPGRTWPGMVPICGCLLGSIWVLRYATGYFQLLRSPDLDISAAEIFFRSVIETLQTFSLEGDFSEFVLQGKELLRTILGQDTPWAGVYGVYAWALTLLAPLAGGAIILTVLASLFPRLKLRLSYLAFWQTKYFFSELNPYTLALARSIRQSKSGFFTRPVLIFANAYRDRPSEDEDLAEAANLRAICLKENLDQTRLSSLGDRKFLLIHEQTASNMQMLGLLANGESQRYLKKAEVYLFAQDDSYTLVEQKICEKLKSECGFPEEDMPVFIPVLNYRNMITNLLNDLPLYTPLVGRDTDTLTVTILGTGSIGMEMFLNTYWLGQLLDHKLKIQVVSTEDQAHFWGKLDYINPEIRHTTIAGDPILAYDHHGHCTEPYCTVEYLNWDTHSSEFMEALRGRSEDRRLLDTDYFLVALGSDEENMAIAHTLQRYVGAYHLADGAGRHTVIAYVIFDDQLSVALNRPHSSDLPDVYMRCVGSLGDMCSARNVFMQDHIAGVSYSQEWYDTIQNKAHRTQVNRQRIQDNYKYWANLARAMHQSYKMFSTGLITESVFDGKAPGAVQVGDDPFAPLIKGWDSWDAEEKEKHMRLLHRLSWLEHRRWSAFSRVQGFRNPVEYRRYLTEGQAGSYKHMGLRLHPCLVECDDKGIRGQIDHLGRLVPGTDFSCTDPEQLDLLDELSYRLKELGVNDYDFKQYDYPSIKGE